MASELSLLSAAFQRVFDTTSAALQRRLRALGAESLRALSYFVAPDEDVNAVYDSVVDYDDLDDRDRDDFLYLLAIAGELRGRQVRASANRALEELRAAASAQDARRQQDLLERMFLSRAARPVTSSSSARIPPTAPPRPPRRARTALGITVRGAVGLDARVSEMAQRERYLDELADLLLELGAPVVDQVSSSADVRAALKLTAGGRRARTLRTRLRGWRAFARWLGPAKGVRYPTSWSSVLEYAQERADEPCGKQSLLGLFWAVAFVERAGGYGSINPITASPLYQAACKEVLAKVTARAGGQPAAPARRPLVAVMAMLELAIGCDEVPMWMRGFAFWKLLQCWCTLRHDDHRGINPTDWRPSQAGLTVTLLRSKTTGADKRVDRRPIGISCDAYLVLPDWCERGLGIWRTLAPWPRDYLLAAPDAGLGAAVPRELTYGEASGWSRAWYHRLCDERGLSCLRDHVGSRYTEHSGRHWLPSVAYAMGAPEADLEVLGGWAAKPSRAYLDSVADKMMAIQAGVARRLRANAGGADVAGEARLLSALEEDLVGQGLAREVVVKELAELRFFPGPCGQQPPWVGGAADGGTSVEVDAGPPAAKKTRLQPSELKAVPLEERGYVVSISAKTGFRRLHYAGACHRVPGVHYAVFEWLGQVLPDSGAYDDYCAKCWPEAPPERGVRETAARDAVAATRPEVVGAGAADELEEGAMRSEASEDDSSSTDVGGDRGRA